MHTTIGHRSPVVTDVTKMCRVCMLSKHEADALRTMASTVKVLILQVLSIEVDSERSWKICVPCLEFIEKAAQFRKMAKKSDQQIKALLNNGEKQKETVYVHTPEESVELDSEIVVEDEIKFETEPERYSTELVPIRFSAAEEYHSSLSPSPLPHLLQPTPTQFLPVFKCDTCSATFGRKRLLDRHRATRHTMQRNGTTTRLLLTPTTRTTNGMTPKQHKKYAPRFSNGLWHCCGHTYANKSSLNKHKNRDHPDTKGPAAKGVFCMSCDQKYKDVSALYHHIKNVHKGKRPTGCNICGKKFNSSDTLRKHKLRVHSELYQD